MEKDLSELLFFQFHRISNLLHNKQKEARNGLELENGQGRLLRFLYKKDGLSQKELATLINIKPASLSELISKLEYKKQINKKTSPTDKRVFQIYITDEGKKIAEYIMNARKEVSQEVFSFFAENEKKELSILLQKLMDSLLDD